MTNAQTIVRDAGRSNNYSSPFLYLIPTRLEYSYVFLKNESIQLRRKNSEATFPVKVSSVLHAYYCRTIHVGICL